VHALRHVHQLLVPGGTLIDLHPVTEGRIEAAQDVVVGVIPEPEFVTTHLPNAEAGLERMVAAGLYEPEVEIRFDVLQHFETVDELLERHVEPLASEDALVDRVRSSTPPFVVREHVVFRRLRAQ
jgi:hypothetical protein